MRVSVRSAHSLIPLPKVLRCSPWWRSLALTPRGRACLAVLAAMLLRDWGALKDLNVLQGGDTEIDIEIDPELVPILEPQFLDEKLQALSQKWSG